MADNQAQQIMVSDAYHPQGKGGEWLATQLPHNPLTMGLDTEPELDDAHSVTGGMLAAVLGVVAGFLGGVAFAMVLWPHVAQWLAQGVRP